jgi:hypothetical protein
MGSAGSDATVAPLPLTGVLALLGTQRDYILIAIKGSRADSYHATSRAGCSSSSSGACGGAEAEG